jgi:hypothetical protein
LVLVSRESQTSRGQGANKRYLAEPDVD